MRLVLALALLLTLSSGADEVWDRILEGRPGLVSRQKRSLTTLDRALLAQAEGDVGEAWRLVRQLESEYQPGTQPAEFFWLRAQLLGTQQWALTAQNLRGVLETTRSDELRLLALLAQAEGLTQQKHGEEARQAWLQAAQLANRLPSSPARPWRVHLGLFQARQHLSQRQTAEALGVLAVTRGQASWPALASMVELQLAQAHAQLADWAASSRHYENALQLARQAPEPALIEGICGLWVEQQVQRSTDQASVERCLQALRRAQRWYSGRAKIAVLSQKARLEAQALDRIEVALVTLEQAISLSSPGKGRAWLLAEGFLLCPPGRRLERRQFLTRLHNELESLGPLQPEDPVSKRLPRFGIWAAIAETYLPAEPERAEETFALAYQQSQDRHARLRVLGFQLGRYLQAGQVSRARRGMNQLLELVHAGPIDETTLSVVRSQILELNRGSRHVNRLLFRDEIHTPPESPISVLLKQLLSQETIFQRLEQDILDQIRQAQTPQDSCRAYLARAQLLSAQNRGLEAALATLRLREVAQQGELPLQEALAERMLAEMRWTLGLYRLALEGIARAEQLYASSGNPGDQVQAQECRLLRAYFLLKTHKVDEALELCTTGTGPWFCFLEGRCFLEKGDLARAEQALSRCHFEEELSEIARLAYLARVSSDPQPYFQEALSRAQKVGSISGRDLGLDWAAWLRSQGQEERANQVEAETRTWMNQFLAEYPPEIRERLLDQPLTQKLFGLTSATTEVVPTPRESRRTFLAQLNQVRQRYPRMDNELPVSATDLVSLQESIPANRVLLQYFAGESDLYIMRIDQQGCRLEHLAVEKAGLVESVQQIRQALSRRQNPPDLAARRLYLSLVRPLGDLKGKQVQVVPSGFLWYLPWDVLKDEEGRYLVESLEWSCVAPSELLRDRFQPATRSQESPQMVAFGGADPELPATAQEARFVASLFQQGRALVGEQASSQQLIQLAPQADVLHLATHSALHPSLNQIFIQLSDGAFRLEQIYGLKLKSDLLVVLSSCESALGQDDPGREVSSLATAFLASGASSVVATLWKVEDDSSEAFFRRFYPHWLRLGSISQALRQTRLDCLKDPDLQGPWGWGAYQLYGEP